MRNTIFEHGDLVRYTLESDELNSEGFVLGQSYKVERTGYKPHGMDWKEKLLGVQAEGCNFVLVDELTGEIDELNAKHFQRVMPMTKSIK